MDFYDSKDTITQTNYFTVILPVQQGFTVTEVVSSYKPSVQIKIPSFKLDYIGDKEGFFLYWLRNKKFLDISKFYMSAKFYDAKNGFFTKMINMPQSSILGNKFVFDNTDYFYYRVQMDYDKQTYQVFSMNPSQQEYDSLNKRAGAIIPIKWYEYVNP